jgi:hypothetical protein
VVVRRMALQAEHGLAYGLQAAIHGAVRRVALGAVFHDRRMLISERPFEFRVALQAELVDAIGPEIVRGSAAMWIMAIGARHFSFPRGMVIRQLGLRGLFVVATLALRVFFLERSELDFRSVHLVAVDALHVLTEVSSGGPVEQSLVLAVAAQADAVGLLGGLFAKLDDLLVVRAGGVQTAVAMALLALQFLQAVNGVVNAFRRSLVAGTALIGADPFRPGYFQKL